MSPPSHTLASADSNVVLKCGSKYNARPHHLTSYHGNKELCKKGVSVGTMVCKTLKYAHVQTLTIVYISLRHSQCLYTFAKHQCLAVFACVHTQYFNSVFLS